MIIAFSVGKGGVGKTTAAISTAVEWHRRKLRVLLVDLDPQRSALEWRNIAERAGHSAPPCIAMGDSFSKDLPRIAKNYDRIVLDAPGQRDGVMRACLMHADCVVMPVQALPLDVWAVADSFTLARKAQGMRPELKTMILLSRIDARTNYSRTVRKTLEDSELPVLKAEINQLMDYAASITVGQAPTTYAPDGKAAKEIKQLCRELDLVLGKKERKHRAIRSQK